VGAGKWVAGGGIFAAMLNMMVWETFDSIIRHVHGMYRCEPGGQSVFNRELPGPRYIYSSP
jgi:hypothetical protein